MSADYEEILDSSEQQKPKPKVAKIVNFWYFLSCIISLSDTQVWSRNYNIAASQTFVREDKVIPSDSHPGLYFNQNEGF